MITLTPCPKGVNGNDAWHYLYISKTGTPEVVLITGGTCISRQSSGTIDFTAQYSHPVGYSIGSATDGIQEAIVDAAVTKAAGAISRNVLIDPGQHLLHARLSIRNLPLAHRQPSRITSGAFRAFPIMSIGPND